MTVRELDAYPRHDEDVAPFARDLGLPGIIDLHVHAMPHRLEQAVWSYFDSLTDPPWEIRYRGEPDVRLAQLRSFGVTAHTALAYAHKPGMLDWLNRHTLALAARHPQVIPTFTIFPQDDVAEATADAIGRGGQVVKVHNQVGRFVPADPLLDEAWELIASARLPVMMHASAVYGVPGGAEFCGAARVADLLDRHPDLTLVIAHLGRPDNEDFLRLAERTPGLYLDVSMALVVGEGGIGSGYPLPDRLAALWPRVVFGSDFPGIMHAYAAQVRGLGLLGLDDDQLRAVLHDNAQTLLSRTA